MRSDILRERVLDNQPNNRLDAGEVLVSTHIIS